MEENDAGLKTTTYETKICSPWSFLYYSTHDLNSFHTIAKI